MTQPDLLQRPDHDSFYERYPRKKAPGRSERAYDKAIKLVSREELQEAVMALRALWDDHIKGMDTKERNTAKGWFPYPATWLNDKGWGDEEIQEYLAREKAPPEEPIVFDHDDIWYDQKTRLLKAKGEKVWRTWFKDMALSAEGKTIVATFPTRFLTDWCRKEYEADMERAFGYRVKFEHVPTPYPPGDE